MSVSVCPEFDDLAPINQFHVVMDWLKYYAPKAAREAIACEVIPDGVIQLEIRSLGHAPDLLASEKIEEWLNTVGLQTAAELLPLEQTPAQAGPNQLSLNYSNAA